MNVNEENISLLPSQSMPAMHDDYSRLLIPRSGKQGKNGSMRRRRQGAWSSLVDLAALEVQEHMGLGGGSVVADDDDYPENIRYRFSVYPFERKDFFPEDDAASVDASEFGEHYSGSGIVRTAVTYVKGMVGTYILYLPHLFAIGGIVSSSVTLIALAVLSTYAMIILLDCRKPGIRSYGDVGYEAAGVWGKAVVEISLVLCQLGFCATYYIFVSKNLGILLGWSSFNSILFQLLFYMPLACVRQLKYLGAGMFVANIFLLVGLCIVVWYMALEFDEHGITSSIELVKPSQAAMVLGSILCAFEGVGLVFPIQDAMKENLKPKFGKLLCYCMFGIASTFLLFAIAGYLAFGSSVADFITMEIPVDSVSGIIVRLLYSVGILLSFPLQLFPAVKIIERVIFPPMNPSGLSKRSRHWWKNVLRISICILVAVAALVGGYAFDVFVALVGAICSIPIALVYPPIFHMRLKKGLSRTTKSIDFILAIFGTIGVLLATVTSLESL